MAMAIPLRGYNRWLRVRKLAVKSAQNLVKSASTSPRVDRAQASTLLY